MDNFKIDIHTEGQDHLLKCLELAFTHCGKAAGYVVMNHSIVLFWSPPTSLVPDYTAFPFPANVEFATKFVWEWLSSSPVPRSNDEDVETGLAFRVHCDDWGHVEPYGWPAFVKITRSVALYGK